MGEGVVVGPNLDLHDTRGGHVTLDDELAVSDARGTIT